MTMTPGPNSVLWYQGTSYPDPATVTGSHGAGWRLRLPPIGERGRPDFDGTVDGFVVRVPGAHPCWDHWLVSLIHLRPIVGGRDPHIAFPGATHELTIASLNPEQPLPSLDQIGDGAGFSWLTPFDVVQQFQARDDAVAQRILELAVNAICAGVASPDQDWRSWWREMLLKTATHYAEGKHDVTI